MIYTKTKTFFDFFPPPRFLEIPSPGLSIDESGVRLIEFKKDQKKGLILGQFGKAEFAPGAIVSGNIKDAQKIIKTLEDFRKKYGLDYIRTMVPDERGYLFRVKIPEVPGQDLKIAVESSIEENVPLSTAETVFDFNILNEVKTEADKQLEISVSAVSKEVVNEYLEIFRVAGFSPLHFETESQAVAKAVVPRADLKTHLIINIGAQKVGLYIVFLREVAFSSVIPVKLISTVGPEAPQVIDEIEKIVLYWQNVAEKEGRGGEIDEILLCGRSAIKSGVLEFFTKKLKKPVKIANVWVNAFSLNDYIPEISSEDSLDYAAAIGLALAPNYIYKDV